MSHFVLIAEYSEIVLSLAKSFKM